MHDVICGSRTGIQRLSSWLPVQSGILALDCSVVASRILPCDADTDTDTQVNAIRPEKRVNYTMSTRARSDIPRADEIFYSSDDGNYNQHTSTPTEYNSKRSVWYVRRPLSRNVMATLWIHRVMGKSIAMREESRNKLTETRACPLIVKLRHSPINEQTKYR